jgi:hypothetical protein
VGADLVPAKSDAIAWVGLTLVKHLAHAKANVNP